MERTAPLLLVLAIVLAGCSGQPTSGVVVSSPPAERVEARVNETTGAVSGIVVDSEKAPLPNVTLALGEGAGATTTVSGSTGAFTFNDVEPGSYKLFAQRLGHRSAATKVDVLAGEVTEVRLELERLVSGPAFPTEVRLFGTETAGGWFQVPYAEATPFLPDGFSAKPHVLGESNGQTAELSFYVTKYRNGTLDGSELPEGYWAFVVFSVTPSEDHAGSGATVQFVPIASYASDPELSFLLSAWGTATAPGTITFTRTGAGDQGHAVTASLTSDAGAFDLTVGNAGEEGALTSGALSVRVFGIQEKTVVSYVDIGISSVLYSITGAARVEGAVGIPVLPQATAGEGYVQWGAQTAQVMTFEAAEQPAS